MKFCTFLSLFACYLESQTSSALLASSSFQIQQKAVSLLMESSLCPAVFGPVYFPLIDPIEPVTPKVTLPVKKKGLGPYKI